MIFDPDIDGPVVLWFCPLKNHRYVKWEDDPERGMTPHCTEPGCRQQGPTIPPRGKMRNNTSDHIVAPFTPPQVEALNKWQDSSKFHPFTCSTEGGCRDRLGTDGDERKLIATRAGWICPTCDRVQVWAHSFMLEE